MKSYLKFLSRNKLYTAIEAVGLAVSLAFVILIGSYVVQQYRMAHENPAWVSFPCLTLYFSFFFSQQPGATTLALLCVR